MDPLNDHQFSPDISVAAGATASRFERSLTVLARLAVALLCLIVTTSVLSRWLYGALIPDDVLLVRELMVAVILLPLAAVTAGRGHIAVTVFSDWAGPRAQFALSLLGHVVGLLFVAALLWAGMRLLTGAWASGEYYDGDLYIPLWLGYAVYVVGLAAFLARLGVMCGRDVMYLAARK